MFFGDDYDDLSYQDLSPSLEIDTFFVHTWQYA